MGILLTTGGSHNMINEITEFIGTAIGGIIITISYALNLKNADTINDKVCDTLYKLNIM